jgi:hypothetical protein
MLHTLWIVLTTKLPLVLLVLAVWWAIHEEPDDPGTQDDDGGVRRPGQHSRPLKPFPRPPRRGPHGEPAPPSPPRVRTVHARARTYGR